MPFSSAAEAYPKLDGQRIAEIESWLAETPFGLGPNCDDREVFDALASLPASAKAIRDTEELAGTPFPAWNDDDYHDTIALDLSAAYGIPWSVSLTRTFSFSRKGEGTLKVRDDFAFADASSFETPLTTKGTWKQIGERTLEFTHRGESVQVSIESTCDIDLTEPRNGSRIGSSRTTCRLHAARVTRSMHQLVHLGIPRALSKSKSCAILRRLTAVSRLSDASKKAKTLSPAWASNCAIHCSRAR